MDLLYKKLFEVIVWHDFYLKSLDENKNSIWPSDYNILNDLEFVPTPECKKILQNHQMVFKPCPTGFNVYIRALHSEILATEDVYKSFIYIPDNLRLTFLVRIKNSCFTNYTNLRLSGNDKYQYFFSNRTGHIKNTIPFLTATMLSFQNIVYQWGDLIYYYNKVREAKQIINPGGSINLNNWVTHDVKDASYVTQQDRIPWQSPDYTFDRQNDHPGEIIKFELTDIRGNKISLGNIPNTDVPQDTLIAPDSTVQTLHYKLNLSEILTGRYTLKIQRITPEQDYTFYMLNPLLYGDSFAVIELYPDANQDMSFVEYQQAGNYKESLIKEKSFQVRFKNRLTTWKYIFPDAHEYIVDSPMGLSRFPVKLTYNINKPVLPNAGIYHIDPVTNNALIENIYSEIILNEQY